MVVSFQASPVPFSHWQALLPQPCQDYLPWSSTVLKQTMDDPVAALTEIIRDILTQLSGFREEWARKTEDMRQDLSSLAKTCFVSGMQSHVLRRYRRRMRSLSI